MFLNKNNDSIKEEAKKILTEEKDKSEAISKVVELFANEKYASIIAEVSAEAKKAESDKAYADKLGLRVLNKEEEKFYEDLKNAKQAFNGDQADVIPQTIVDLTLENIRTEEPILDLIDFSPAGVTKWIVAEKTGTYSWEGLTEKLKGELNTNFDSVITNLGKLDAYLVIPKAIRDLALPFVDRYFMAVLSETMRDGLVDGFLNGDGNNKPTGIYKKISESTNGVHKDKETATDLTNFSPKGLAKAKKYLTKEGIRSIDALYLICNPADEADYVAPALYDATGNLISSFKNITVLTTPVNPQGKAVLTLNKKYVMATDGIKVQNYEQTMALDDADVIIAKTYANGRAVDDNTAYVFDVTKLEEYVPTIKAITVNSDGTVGA